MSGLNSLSRFEENSDDENDDSSKTQWESNIIPFKKHKRAHSRNKSITGRQDFLEEIANSEFKKQTDNPLNVDCNSNGADQENHSEENDKEKEMLLPQTKTKLLQILHLVSGKVGLSIKH